MSDEQSDGSGMDASKRRFVYEYDFPDRLLNDDRGRGLSKIDRRFLVTGETSAGTPSESVRSNTHTRIRRRIRETIVDFWLISVYLNDHDRELIFGERGVMEDWEMREGIKNTMQFFYRGLADSNLMDFETALTSAVHDAERERHDGPVLVETEFEVDVDEQFHVQEAYDKFRKGAPLDTMEVGALLITGRVTDPDEVVRLAQHARGHGLVESSISPLLAEQLSKIDGGPPDERLYTTLAHIPDTEAWSGPGADPAEEPLRSRDIFDWEPPTGDSRPATPADLSNVDIDDDAEILDEEVGEDEDPDATLRELSIDLDQPITVGDEAVYEDGDRNPLNGAGGDEKGADSPADTDDDADDAEG